MKPEEIRKWNEKHMLEQLLRKEPFNSYIIDESSGVVYQRNLDFEAFGGNLYEVYGSLGAKAISSNKEKMNPKSVKFIDEDNRVEMLNIIESGWSSRPQANLANYF